MKVVGGKKSGIISRLFKIVTLMLVVLLTALWFAARSETGRKLVEKKLSKRFGIPVSIGTMRIGWPYRLFLENVQTKGFEAAGSAGFSVQDVSLSHGFRYWKLSLGQLILRVKKNNKDGWDPERLARIGDLKNAEIEDLVRLTESIRNRLVLRISDSNISWLDIEGIETAFARDVDFRMVPAHIDKRTFHYYYLSVYNADGIVMVNGRDIKKEWLTTSGIDYIELPDDSKSSRNHRQQPPPVNDLIDNVMSPQSTQKIVSVQSAPALSSPSKPAKAQTARVPPPAKQTVEGDK